MAVCASNARLPLLALKASASNAFSARFWLFSAWSVFPLKLTANKRPRASRVSVVRSRMERGDIVALPAGDLVKPLERRFTLFYVKKFFGVSLFYLRKGCFVWAVYLRDYPNPYLYTHTGPIGDIGLLALPACRRAPYSLPYTYYFFFFFFVCLSCVVAGLLVLGSCWSRSPAAAAASTIPINRNMCIVDNLAV